MFARPLLVASALAELSAELALLAPLSMMLLADASALVIAADADDNAEDAADMPLIVLRETVTELIWELTEARSEDTPTWMLSRRELALASREEANADAAVPVRVTPFEMT